MKEQVKVMRQLRLVMIDEIQCLNEDRGPTLEAVISRIKTMQQSINSADEGMSRSPSVRFIGVSATCPNLDDIASWLNCDLEHCKSFGEEFRPVKLVCFLSLCASC